LLRRINWHKEKSAIKQGARKGQSKVKASKQGNKAEEKSHDEGHCFRSKVKIESSQLIMR
jgi:hypothetical protein